MYNKYKNLLCDTDTTVQADLVEPLEQDRQILLHKLKAIVMKALTLRETML